MNYDLVSLNAIEGITVGQVRNYAALYGWQPVKNRREDVLLMRNPHRKVSEIALPLSSEFADYREAIAIAVSRLAIYLEQPAWKVIDEIVTTVDPLASAQQLSGESRGLNRLSTRRN